MLQQNIISNYFTDIQINDSYRILRVKNVSCELQCKQVFKKVNHLLTKEGNEIKHHC